MSEVTPQQETARVQPPHARPHGWVKKPKIDMPTKTFRTFLTSTVKSVDLRSKCPPVYDQGQLGSCTANSIGFIHEFDQMKQNSPNVFTPSRLFIYYNERDMEGTVSQDSGAAVSDSVKTITKQGVCPETMWPYDISKFAVKPPASCYTEALNNQAVKFLQVNQTLNDLKQALIEGFPIAFGFTVYQSFESDAVAKSGILPMPQPGETVIGGHAVAIVGFDDSKSAFIARNSWSATWGLNGYFMMPYAYITDPNLASDFWVVQSVEVANQPPGAVVNPPVQPVVNPSPKPKKKKWILMWFQIPYWPYWVLRYVEVIESQQN